MESVGQKLRAIRLQRGLTLEDISAKTRISTRNLQAIERDDLSPIGSSFFYRSFVKQFAQQLNLNYSELEPAVQSLASSLPEPLMPGQTSTGVPLPSIRSLRPRRRKGLRWIYSFTSLVAMLIACSTLYSMWQNSRSELQFSKLPGRISSVVHSFTNRSPERRSPASRAESQPLPAVTVTESIPAASAAFHVELSAIERTWLSIIADGRETFTGVLEAAQTKTLDGHETARVRMGNAGGLNVVFNGRAIGSLGPRGRMCTVVFTKDGYETVEPPATPAAHLSFTPLIPNGE